MPTEACVRVCSYVLIQWVLRVREHCISQLFLGVKCETNSDPKARNSGNSDYHDACDRVLCGPIGSECILRHNGMAQCVTSAGKESEPSLDSHYNYAMACQRYTVGSRIWKNSQCLDSIVPPVRYAPMIHRAHSGFAFHAIPKSQNRFRIFVICSCATKTKCAWSTRTIKRSASTTSQRPSLSRKDVLTIRKFVLAWRLAYSNFIFWEKLDTGGKVGPPCHTLLNFRWPL